jgi:hypothetical protein
MGSWVHVAPKAITPEPATQVRRSPLPSPQAQGPAAHCRARGVPSHGCARPPTCETRQATNTNKNLLIHVVSILS